MNYKDKSTSYFSNIRYDLVNLLDASQTNLKVMEIGAAYGETLFYIKSKGIASEVVGVDIFEDKENKENYKNLDRFIFDDIERIDFPEYYGYFDLILLPDVLEHLIEPKNVLNKVRKYLKDDGIIIVSMPNIRHYSALKKIFINGDFGYEESGIFDSTHLRFYCRKNIKELLENSGFKTLLEVGAIKNYKGNSITKIINKLTLGVFEEFFSYQYFFKSKKV
jgi:2-polyprenyl-3-methyl-5-hydroxy-6-metoxy-1,4-benzoquinol methylase